jgi:hypothetical protein
MARPALEKALVTLWSNMPVQRCLAKATLASILNQAGLAIEELLKLL